MYWPWKRLYITAILKSGESQRYVSTICKSTKVYRIVADIWKVWEDRVPRVIKWLSRFSQETRQCQGRSVRETRQSLLYMVYATAFKRCTSIWPFASGKGIALFFHRYIQIWMLKLLKLVLDGFTALHPTFQSHRQFQNSGNPLVPHCPDKWGYTVLRLSINFFPFSLSLSLPLSLSLSFSLSSLSFSLSLCFSSGV